MNNLLKLFFKNQYIVVLWILWFMDVSSHEKDSAVEKRSMKMLV